MGLLELTSLEKVVRPLELVSSCLLERGMEPQKLNNLHLGMVEKLLNLTNRASLRWFSRMTTEWW